MKWKNNNSSLEDALKYTCEKNDMKYIPADKAVPVDHIDILDEDTGLIRRFKSKKGKIYEVPYPYIGSYSFKNSTNHTITTLKKTRGKVSKAFVCKKVGKPKLRNAAMAAKLKHKVIK